MVNNLKTQWDHDLDGGGLIDEWRPKVAELANSKVFYVRVLANTVLSMDKSLKRARDRIARHDLVVGQRMTDLTEMAWGSLREDAERRGDQVLEQACGMILSLKSQLKDASDRASRHDLVVDHCQTEFYHKGRRDAVFDIVGGLEGQEGVSFDLPGYLQGRYEAEVQAYKDSVKPKAKDEVQ